MRFAFTFIVLSLLLTACGHRDAKIQQELAGTWVASSHGVYSTNVVGTDGSYECQITGFPNGMVVRVEGTLLVKNGVLIDTITKSSQTNAPVPHISRGQIIRLDDHEFVSRWDGMANTVARKVEK